MWPRFAVALSLVLLAGVAARAAAPVTAQALYERAVERDRAARASMARPHPGSQPDLKVFRDAIAAYRLVVWRHPTSGYCDNALWQGAQLAIEAFDRFGQERDRQLALTLMRALVREYPFSGLVQRARASIARVEALGAAPVATRPAKPLQAAAPASPPQAADDPLVTIGYVQRTATEESTEIVVYLDGPVAFREERLSNPARVFFDLVGSRPAESIKDAILTFGSGLVRQIRVGRHPDAITRIVIDADGVGLHRAEVLAEPYRLVVTCWPAAAVPSEAAAPPARRPARPEDTPPEPVIVTAQPAPTPRNAPLSAPRAARTPLSSPAAPAPGNTPTARAAAAAGPVPATPSINVRGAYSLARQLGLGANRIVIDAGHGGHDPGSMNGRMAEAAIALDIALRLEKLLLKQPGIEVVLTRRTDVYLPLQERTEIANREAADLFVSIHVNASVSAAARGVETYLLDFATTPDAEAVAARENASTVMTLANLNDLVKKIALTTKADESRDLAAQVQGSMVRRLKPHNGALRDLGVKRAPFVVLIGAEMPSVLVEVAFLTHKQEGRLLARSTYRQRVAESLLDGIRRYLRSLKKTPR